jgi:DNA gyrase/topoisomerase IV subunit B
MRRTCTRLSISRDEDIELALTHGTRQYGEEYYSFVNGQHTSQGGTHLLAFKEALVQKLLESFTTKTLMFLIFVPQYVAASEHKS